MVGSHIAYVFRRRKDAEAFASSIDRRRLEPGATVVIGSLPSARFSRRVWNAEITLPGETEPYASMSLSEIEDDVLTPVAELFGGRFSGH